MKCWCSGSKDNDLFCLYCVFVCAGEPPTPHTHLHTPTPPAIYLPLSLPPQIDLEPEGKVYVVIDLSGSSTEGKNTTTQCSSNEKA